MTMKPITCSDVEPTLIEYFSSIDDDSLAESNQQVPGLILEHLASCSDCAEIYQGFHSAIANPADSRQFEPMTLSAQAIQQQVNSIKQSLDLCPKQESQQSQQKATPPRNSAAESDSGLANLLPQWLHDVFASSGFRPAYGVAAAIAVCVVTFSLTWPKAPSFQQDVVAFQTGLDISPQTVEYVYKMRDNLAPKAWSAFTPERNNPFMLGAYYAESIALYLQQDAGAGRDHLLFIMDQIKGRQDLRHSYDYLQKLAQHLNDPAFSKQQALRAFANFSQIYLKEIEDNYSKDIVVEEQTVMFEFGAWVVNLNLAALAKEEDIRFENDNLKYFNIHVLPLSIPVSVVNTLDEIGRVLGKGNYNEQDYQKLFSLGMKLRTQLG